MNCCTSAFHSNTHTHTKTLSLSAPVSNTWLKVTGGQFKDGWGLRRKTVKTKLVSQLQLSQCLFPASAGLQLSSSANFKSCRTKDKTNSLVWSRSISQLLAHDFGFYASDGMVFLSFSIDFVDCHSSYQNYDEHKKNVLKV